MKALKYCAIPSAFIIIIIIYAYQRKFHTDFLYFSKIFEPPKYEKNRSVITYLTFLFRDPSSQKAESAVIRLVFNFLTVIKNNNTHNLS